MIYIHAFCKGLDLVERRMFLDEKSLKNLRCVVDAFTVKNGKGTTVNENETVTVENQSFKFIR